MKNLINISSLFTLLWVASSCQIGSIEPKLQQPTFNIKCEDIYVNTETVSDGYVWRNHTYGANLEDLNVVEGQEISFKADGFIQNGSNVTWAVNNKTLSNQLSFRNTFKGSGISEVKMSFGATSGTCTKVVRVHAGVMRNISIKVDLIPDICTKIVVGMTCTPNNVTKTVSPLYYENTQRSVCWKSTSTDAIVANSHNIILASDTHLKFQVVKNYLIHYDGGIFGLLNLLEGNKTVFIRDTVTNAETISSILFTAQNTNNWAVGKYKIQGYTLIIQ